MYPNELIEITKKILDSIEAEYTFKDNFFRFNTIINDKIKDVCFIIHIEENGFTASAIPEDITVTETKMTEVLEYINMVNIETIDANMLIYEDIVMCSYTLNCRGMHPDVEQIQKCLVALISCLETFGSGLLDVIAGIGTPKEIFEKCMEADRDV